MTWKRGHIKVSGETPTGYIRYRLELAKDGIQLIPEKGGVEFQTLILKGTQMRTPPNSERLSLGNHKAQNWSNVVQRRDLTEILPIWMKLGQMIPYSFDVPTGSSLLSACDNPEDPYRAFANLWKAGFEGILSPRAIDEQLQGFSLPPIPPQEAPLALLSQGAILIRKLFFAQKGNVIAILPNLPSQFHCGRMTGMICGVGSVDMEWSKKTNSTPHFNSFRDREDPFSFSKRSCHLAIEILC